MGVATLTPPAQRIGEELVYPDGRHELADDRAIRESPLYNADLAPVPIKRRTWSTYNYMALWIGMAHNIPTYLLASGLVALGMAWYQAILTIALANIIVLIPMLANSHAGTKYGIPYPVFASAAFGVFGPILSEPGKVGWGSNFWLVLFPPALMGMIAFWSTLSLNMPDFTRFGKSQRAQALGQIFGLPTTMTLFPLVAVLITAATQKVYGAPIWDPLAL